MPGLTAAPPPLSGVDGGLTQVVVWGVRWVQHHHPHQTCGRESPEATVFQATGVFDAEQPEPNRSMKACSRRPRHSFAELELRQPHTSDRLMSCVRLCTACLCLIKYWNALLPTQVALTVGAWGCSTLATSVIAYLSPTPVRIQSASIVLKGLSSIWCLIWTASVSGDLLVGFSWAATRLCLSISSDKHTQCREPNILIGIAWVCRSTASSHVSHTQLKRCAYPRLTL